eukprot:TRINITY_DN6955_c0_g1_i3.p1 TRINITY_DN6955_c0_g1~~TRINITY_DN6955_c0_g1_i3.p1  ORF type:complete len:339 (+),score=82.82 TRINITY_DN6955_c0_g1_i3:39-1055(+)
MEWWSVIICSLGWMNVTVRDGVVECYYLFIGLDDWKDGPFSNLYVQACPIRWTIGMEVSNMGVRNFSVNSEEPEKMMSNHKNFHEAVIVEGIKQKRAKIMNRPCDSTGAMMTASNKCDNFMKKTAPALKNISSTSLYKLIKKNIPDASLLQSWTEAFKLMGPKKKAKVKDPNRYWIVHQMGKHNHLEIYPPRMDSPKVGHLDPTFPVVFFKKHKDPEFIAQFTVVSSETIGKWRSNASVIFIVYDPTDREEFELIEKRLKEGIELSTKEADQIVKVLIAIQSTTNKKEEVNDEEGMELSRKMRGFWIKTRSLDHKSEEMKRLFRKVTHQCYLNYPIWL